MLIKLKGGAGTGIAENRTNTERNKGSGAKGRAITMRNKAIIRPRVTLNTVMGGLYKKINTNTGNVTTLNKVDSTVNFVPQIKSPPWAVMVASRGAGMGTPAAIRKAAKKI